MNKAVSRLAELAPNIKPLTNIAKKRELQIKSTKNSLQALMDAGLHYGNSTEVWHRNALPFIYGRREGIHIINLEHTLIYLKRAANVVREVSKNGGNILFVGSRSYMKQILADAAVRSNNFYVTCKWTKGTLSDYQNVLKHSLREGNTRFIHPDLIIVLDMNNSQECLHEATLKKVPTIGLIDTDCDAAQVTYAIPGNDDSYGGIELIANVLANASIEGKQQRRE
jgi:small subunit ribosomal protein S2